MMKLRAALFLVLAFCSGCAIASPDAGHDQERVMKPQPRGSASSDARRSTVVRWEHGWRTPRVIATRYTNSHMGYNIGFTFPLNPDDCDRAELGEFMQKHGGAPYQMGGYSGAPIFVIFEGVRDRKTADRKLEEILPALDALVRTFNR